MLLRAFQNKIYVSNYALEISLRLVLIYDASEGFDNVAGKEEGNGNRRRSQAATEGRPDDPRTSQGLILFVTSL